MLPSVASWAQKAAPIRSATDTMCTWLQMQALQSDCHWGSGLRPLMACAPALQHLQHLLTSKAVQCANMALRLPTACALILQKQFNAERVAALLEDRRIREQDEQAHAALAAQRIDELQQRLKNTERALQQATKDYILGGQLLMCIASQLQHANPSVLLCNRAPSSRSGASAEHCCEFLTRQATTFSYAFLNHGSRCPEHLQPLHFA